MQRNVSVAVALAVLVCMVSGDNTGCDYKTCSECISAPGCIWCSDPNITSVEANTGENFLHCINKESPNIEKFQEACKAPILDPPTEQEITEGAELSPGKNISPQRVKLKIRAGESARITLSYEHHVNFPMDLYVLLDGSSSMTVYKGRISDATSEIVKGLNNITTNVKLGFGMFVDKPVLPYTDLNNWKVSCPDCVETFGFKNILSLTAEHNKFQNMVASAPVSTNTDIPEGLLDALMQVASCRTKVGWREEALKAVVVFTDAGFHLAGDGKLAGIVKPNDRECHLDSDGLYTHSLWQDYPSVGEIKSTLQRNNVTTTFAVSAKLLPLYKLLTKQLYYSTCSEMDSDIVALIVEPVRDIITTATLYLKNPVPEIAVNVSSRCKGGEEHDNGTCAGMQPGDKAEFLLDIKINKCRTENQHTELTFQLDSQQQSFVLDIEMLCECNCTESITNADACTSHGDFNCGACECHEGYLGRKCQCIEGDVDNQGIDQKNCMNPNATKGVLCSGQGSCVCGECQCYTASDQEEVISGRYCECSNHHPDCRGTNGEYCSGNGECKCNKCECKSGWEGPVCSCSSSTKDCMDSEGGTCSNHGECVCNRCQCEEDYEGKHCENLVSDRKCEDHKPCVKCLVFEPECEIPCHNYRVTVVSDMTEVYGHLCSSTDEDDCKFLYQFKENGTEVLVWAQEEKECPKEINPWIIVGSVLAGVVLVGILLLVAWKCVTTIKDKKEYAKFEQSASKAVWEDNVSPLYKSPTTQVQNPMFRAPTE